MPDQVAEKLTLAKSLPDIADIEKKFIASSGFRYKRDQRDGSGHGMNDDDAAKSQQTDPDRHRRR